MNRGLLFLALLACACTPSRQLAPTTIANTQSGFPTLAPLRTATPLPTGAPTLPAFDSTRLPTFAVKLEEKPISLIGSGNSVVDVQKWSGRALLRARYTGSDDFIVRSLGPSYEVLELLINTIGSYDGTVALDFERGQQTTRLAVKASGSWVLDVLPLKSARVFTIPGEITGVGDDVVVLRSGSGPKITVKAVSAVGTHNFIVRAYGGRGHKYLLFNKIPPYMGTAWIHQETLVLVVVATGPWSLEVTSS